MDIVKIKKRNIFKFIFLSILMFIGINKAYAVQEIVLTFDNNKITETISGSGYKISGTDLSINNPGVYRIKGSSVEGSITVKKATTGVTIILDNLDLTSSKTAPLTINKDGAEVKLKLVGTNTLIDNEDPDNEFSTDPTVLDLFEAAAIKVKTSSSLTISGDGTLNAVTNTKNAIKGSKLSTIQINSGNLNLTSVKNGLSGDHRIIINGGNITINADSEGIKLSPDEDDTSSIARLDINGGTINITSGEDGIQAIGDIYINNKPNITINSMYDGIQTRSNFYMTNGNINIHTYEGHNATTFEKDVLSAKGIKASPSDDNVTENASNLISITGGRITIDSSDDAIHSDGNVTITKGIINIESFDDAIHADSKIIIGENNGLERDPEININDAYEGIEGGNIYIYSGKIKVITREDGINAAGGSSSGDGSSSSDDHYNPITGEDRFAIYAYGGLVYINSGNDGYDANGSIYLRGGVHIIHSQGRGGTNSALDRDAHLVIDGATVFTSGSVGTNGVIVNIESNQEFVDQIHNYDAGTNITVKSDGNIIFNDTILKDTEYIFATSPNLSSNNGIEVVSELIEDYSSPWSHHDFVESITTAATPTTPGVKTYTCPFGYAERQTYFYDNEVIFNIYNKTNGNAPVTVGDITDKYDFTTLGNDQLIVESDVDFYLISSSDNGLTFNKIPYTSRVSNTYTFALDQYTSQNIYIVYKGDANASGYISAYDELLIRKSLLDQNNPLYLPLGDIETIAADIDEDGDIDEDDISYIQNVQLHMRLNYEYISTRTSDLLKFINSTDSIILDGENDGTIDVYLKANQNLDIDAFEAMFIQNPYFSLTSIEPMFDTTSGTEINSTTNEMLYFVDTDGFDFSNDQDIYKLTFTINKDTPTGDYKLNLKVGVLTEHGTINQIDFNLTTEIHIDGVNHPYTATFNKDDGVKSIDIFHTKNYAVPDETYDKNHVGDIIAYARDKDTGIYVPDDSGQVHFRVNLKKGYVISSVVVEPTENYNKLNGPSKTDSADTYAITKINGDVTVTITTKQAQEYTATFIKDSGIKRVDIYYTHDYTNIDEENVDVTIARNDTTGEIDISGDGQINFKVTPKNGYKIDAVTATGNYKNLKGSEDTGEEGIYRITKIGGDIIVDITSKTRENITLDVQNLETDYEYTGSQITPEITINKAGEDITLVKDVDYTLTYGENTNLGVDGGSITISPLDNSDYNFTETTLYFNIVPYTLTRDNINVPSSIAITGTTLDPKIIVTANESLLVEDTDYTVTMYNLNGNVGENVLVTIQGIGNYTGLVENIEIPIVVKELQVLSFDQTEVTATYGNNFIKTASLSVGNGNITYVSLTPSIATVNPFTGAVILNKKGTTVIKAIAEETEEYAQTETQYILKVEPAPINVSNITADNKVYDGTTAATISSSTFTGLVNDQIFTKDTDYTIEANFDNAEVGENKEVTVTITLLNDNSDKYVLSTSEYTVNASIYAAFITDNDITLDNSEFTYDGSAKNPNPTIVINGNTLVKDTDYTVSYENNINAGTGYIVIEGTGNYKTEEPVRIPFIINKQSITLEIEDIPDVTYNGSQHRPKPVVKYNDTILEENVDYQVSYESNINASNNAKVNISPVETSNYTFDKTAAYASKSFTINPYQITQDDITLEYYNVEYDGTEKKPKVTVTANGIKLIENVEYTVEYAGNIGPSEEARITVTAISSNYTNYVYVTFNITTKNVLDISGISDNQKITYTGDPVILSGNINVSSNPDNITKDDLTIKYYDENNDEIERPTNVGSYSVGYSYTDEYNIGEYIVHFEITKAKSIIPDEVNQTFKDIENNTLSNISFETNGLSWVDSSETIKPGYNSYDATYTKNNDTVNYDTANFKVTVYGNKLINITTSVDGLGGSISDGYTNVVEGLEKEITITPNEGYKIKSVSVNGEEVGYENNKLTVTAEKENIDVIVKFEAIVYDLNISGTEDITADPNGIINVEHKSDKDILIKAKTGYTITSVIVNDVESINDLENDILSVNNITDDTTVYIKAKRIEYEVTEGARQKYTINEDNEATFRINADYSLFTTDGRVFVDNNLVGKKNYSSKDGSTIITFNKEYLDTLNIGVHTLDVYLSDGGVAQTTFTIAKVTTRIIENNSIAKAINKFTSSTNYKSSSTNNSSSNTTNNIENNTNNEEVKDEKEEKTTKKSSSSKKAKQSNTNDNIMTYVIIGSISLLVIAIIIFFIFIKKKDDKKDDLDI